ALAAIPTIDGEQGLFGIKHGDLTAVVSEARRERYQVSRKFMLGHEAVVEAAMSVQGILPARFGMVQDGASIVDDLLAPHHDRLVNELSSTAGCIEVGVKISWKDLQEIIAGIVAGDPILQAARKRLGPRTPQRTRLDIGKRVERAIEKAKAAESGRLLEELKESGGPVEVSVGKCIAEKMVVNASFLVRKVAEDLFTSAIEAFDKATNDRYLVQVVGPLPPYSFVMFGRAEDR
ncbi:MAG: GvpL/GvpF family gas vesicle protein, partial [Candidatus Nanopelagicales bacterium]|nr:GvpL/GvpF family gas vesicle protein [Candidatus Nanopelagicales bacterium]